MSEDLDAAKLTPSLSAIRRLLPLAQAALNYLPLACLLLAVTASVQVLLPQVMRLVIDGPLGAHGHLTLSQRWEELRSLALLFIALLATGFSANYLSTWLLQKFGQNLVLNLRHQLFAKLHRLPITYFDKQAVGRTVSRVVNDSNSLSELFTSVLAAGLGDLILITGILLVLLFTDPVLSLILGLFCPILAALVYWFRNRSAPLYKVQRALVARVNAYFSEILEGLSTVKSFQADTFQKNRFGEMNQESLDNELQLLTLVARFRPGFAVARIAASAALLTLGGWSVHSHLFFALHQPSLLSFGTTGRTLQYSDSSYRGLGKSDRHFGSRGRDQLRPTSPDGRRDYPLQQGELSLLPRQTCFARRFLHHRARGKRGLGGAHGLG